MSMRLWDWAVAAYARPDVSERCLLLQDTHAQNVPLLLWAAWCAGQGRALDEDTLEAAVDTVRAWDGSAISPLRVIRRTLKGPIPDMTDAARESVREKIKAAELAAERALLDDLEALSAPASGGAKPYAPALVAASKAWSRVTPRADLEALAAQLPA